jgi:hypothetical protein
LTSYFFSWNPSVTLGNAVTFYNDMYFYLLIFPFSFFGGEAISKGLVIGLTFLSGISMFYLCRSIRVKNLFCLFPALFYMYSPLLYSRFIAGHLTASFGYALLPVAVALLLTAYQTRESWRAFASGLILALGGQ